MIKIRQKYLIVFVIAYIIITLSSLSIKLICTDVYNLQNFIKIIYVNGNA